MFMCVVGNETVLDSSCWITSCCQCCKFAMYYKLKVY